MREMRLAFTRQAFLENACPDMDLQAAYLPTEIGDIRWAALMGTKEWRE